MGVKERRLKFWIIDSALEAVANPSRGIGRVRAKTGCGFKLIVQIFIP